MYSILKYKEVWGSFLFLTVIFFGIWSLQIQSHALVVASVDGDMDESVEDAQSYLAAAAFAAEAPRATYRVSSTTPQFVLLSFDGSKSVDMLNETLGFQQKLQTEGKPLRFTYFINAVYFLTKAHADLYQAPEKKPGKSAIGFSDTEQDIQARVKAFNTAFALGNEIGSHSAGHWNGRSWSYGEWKEEFTSFTDIVSNVQKNNAPTSVDVPLFLPNIQGFRAPNLGVNNNLFSVEADNHFTYDASSAGSMERWPEKGVSGLWHIPIGTIFVGAKKSPAVAMDYSLWMHQSHGKEEAVRGGTLWDRYYNEIESAYMDYFETNYNGTRAPVVIADHFSKWNDGVYWEAMKTLAENVCGKPQVRCVTFKELVEYLNASGTPSVL